MAQRVITLKVLNEFIQGDNVTIGAAGSVQEILLQVDFRGSSVWANTSRYVTFTDARGTTTKNVMLTWDMMADGETDVYFVPVPGAVRNYPGEISVTLAGYTTDDSQDLRLRVTTEAAKFRVVPNDHASWDGEEVSITLGEQLQAEVDKIKSILNGHWMFLEVGEDGWLYELREDGYPVTFSLYQGILEVGFA